VGYPSSTCSWTALGRLRRRGQRPAGALFVTDDWRQRANLEASGAFAVSMPVAEECVFAAGLEVVLIAAPTEHAVAIAQMLAAAAPRYFATYFRGRGHEVVLQ
jgi:hypothetical protein